MIPELPLPCPNPECRHACKVRDSVTVHLYPPGTVAMYFVLCDLECGYRGPIVETEEEAIRLHNLLCRPSPAADEAAIKAAASEIDDFIEHHDGFSGRMAKIEAILRKHSAVSPKAGPEYSAYLIYYEDSERASEVFVGSGAQQAAEDRFDEVSDSWNAHLFACMQTNCAEESDPLKILSPPAVSVGEQEKERE